MTGRESDGAPSTRRIPIGEALTSSLRPVAPTVGLRIPTSLPLDVQVAAGGLVRGPRHAVQRQDRQIFVTMIITLCTMIMVAVGVVLMVLSLTLQPSGVVIRNTPVPAPTTTTVRAKPGTKTVTVATTVTTARTWRTKK